MVLYNIQIGVEASKMKTRGSTICAKIHGRTFEEREEIIFNENFQPIGPTDQALSSFSNFLGTIARTHVYCPLTFTNWKKLIKVRREEIWNYINVRIIASLYLEILFSFWSYIINYNLCFFSQSIFF